MSDDLRGEAWQHLQKANSQLQRGQYKDALAILAKAEKLAHKAKAHDICLLYWGQLPVFCNRKECLMNRSNCTQPP